jgi:hypothetical protein
MSEWRSYWWWWWRVHAATTNANHEEHVAATLLEPHRPFHQRRPNSLRRLFFLRTKAKAIYVLSPLQVPAKVAM